MSSPRSRKPELSSFLDSRLRENDNCKNNQSSPGSRRDRKKVTCFFIVLCMIIGSGSLKAQQLPLWELGVGLGFLGLPDYRGSDNTGAYAIPYPYIIYRGDTVNIDEGGVRGKIFKSERVKLDISLAGGVPVSSSQDGVRAGMPDLAPTAELGPSLDISLWKSQNSRKSVWMRLPVRSTFSVNNMDINHRGWSFSPYIEYIAESRIPGQWKTGFALGPLYADDAYHNYYYEVKPQYVLAGRPLYHANGGYSGSRMTITLQKKIGDLWLGVFTRYDTLELVEFEDSPLVTTKNYLALGAGVTWVFMKSDHLVELPD